MEKRRRKKKARLKKARKKKSFRFWINEKREALQQKKRESNRNIRVADVLLWIVEIATVCLFAFFLVWFFGQRVSNAGDSMRPVLQNGDIVLVNRMVYNASLPRRGDVIAYHPDGNEQAHYSIKRIVGLPGETVQIQDGDVYIDGEKVEGHIFVSDIEDPGIAEEPIELGEGEFFVIGDNAAGSDDSRMADIGNVKRDWIYGKVWFVTSFGDRFGLVKD